MSRKWWDSTNLVLGAALACAAFLNGHPPAATVDAIAVGVLIVCVSAVAIYRYAAWTHFSNLALGIWAAGAPYMLGFGSDKTAMSVHVVIGLCVATIAIVQLFVIPNAETNTRAASK